ncbi:MAG: DUF3090 family protein [Rudaea sp.]
MTVFILIRHASNDFVKEGRLAGWTPGLHINAAGQREADALARRLAQVPLEAIYSSPLDRALDTANAVAACHKLPVVIKEALGEGRIGDWQGLLIDDLKETDTWKAMQKDPVGVRPPGGGETIEEVQRRIVAAAEDIRRAHPHAIVALVSHADPLKALIAYYLCVNLSQFQRIGINPASASVLIVDEEHAHLHLLNHSEEIKLSAPKPKHEVTPARAAATAPSANGESQKEEKKMTEANILYDMNPVTRVNAGAIGEPGHRVFYLQGRQGTTLVTLQAEKEHISSLSSGIYDMLEKLGEQRADAVPGTYGGTLEEPIEPLFRIGQLGLGYEQDQDLFVIVAYQVSEEEEPESVNVVRLWATREQMRALAENAANAVAGGRPICVLCGRPIDPEGHFCPRRNGHGAKATLA